MKISKVYVAGRMTGMKGPSARWRASWKEKLEKAGLNVFDPQLNSSETGDAMIRTIVNRDIRRILTSDAIIVYGKHPSWGSAMEMVYARIFGSKVITIMPEDVRDVSPWILYHSDYIFGSIESFIEWYRDGYKTDSNLRMDVEVE